MSFNTFLVPREDWESSARSIAAKNDGITVDECYAFGDMMEFLFDNPPYVAKGRGRAGSPNILVEEGVATVAERWLRGRRQKVTLNAPATKSDPAVEAILARVHGSKDKAVDDVYAHYRAMAAENVIGTLLEMYIASEMEHYGWIWCAGEVVKSVDFLKRNDDGFIPLQVKNRSNSENSSSMAIRNGTDIVKWHRLDAYSGRTFWDNFPEDELRGVLTEEGFQTYIKENLT